MHRNFKVFILTRKFRNSILMLSPNSGVNQKNLIFIMATGIVVRTIAPLIKDKRTDPAVIVLDEKGEYAISLLSGHLGGANKLAKEIADFLGGQAVITTASDVNNMTSIDLWAKENALIIDSCNLVPQVATRFINKGELKVYSEVEMKMPEGFLKTDKPSSADVLITNKKTHSPIHPFTHSPVCI